MTAKTKNNSPDYQGLDLIELVEPKSDRQVKTSDRTASAAEIRQAGAQDFDFPPPKTAAEMVAEEAARWDELFATMANLMGSRQAEISAETPPPISQAEPPAETGQAGAQDSDVAPQIAAAASGAFAAEMEGVGMLELQGMSETHTVFTEGDCITAAITDNVHKPRPSGNSEEAALRRLRKDRPDLYQRVIEKKLSAHGAMVQAGFRPRTITVPVDVKAAAAVLARHFQGDATRLIEAIREIATEFPAARET